MILPLSDVIVRPIQRHERARHWLRHPIPHPDWSTPMQKIDLSDLEMANCANSWATYPNPAVDAVSCTPYRRC